MWVLSRLEAIILKYKIGAVPTPIGAVPTPIGAKLSFKIQVGLEAI